jgi:hypothetical protein
MLVVTYWDSRAKKVSQADSLHQKAVEQNHCQVNPLIVEEQQNESDKELLEFEVHLQIYK